MPSSNTPLLNLSLLIDVTFSTPTGDFTSVRFSFGFFRVNQCNCTNYPTRRQNAILFWGILNTLVARLLDRHRKLHVRAGKERHIIKGFFGKGISDSLHVLEIITKGNDASVVVLHRKCAVVLGLLHRRIVLAAFGHIECNSFRAGERAFGKFGGAAGIEPDCCPITLADVADALSFNCETPTSARQIGMPS